MQYFPRDYEDFTSVTRIDEIRADQKNVLIGHFERIWTEKPRPRMSLVKAFFVEKESGAMLECVWFNSPYLAKSLTTNTEVTLIGKAKLSYGKIVLQNPEYEWGTQTSVGSIRPVYREHDKLKTKWLRTKISELLDGLEKIPQLVPRETAEANDCISKAKAIREMHFPQSTTSLRQAKNTIAFEELWLLQIGALMRKHTWEKQGEGSALQIPLILI